MKNYINFLSIRAKIISIVIIAILIFSIIFYIYNARKTYTLLNIYYLAKTQGFFHSRYSDEFGLELGGLASFQKLLKLDKDNNIILIGSDFHSLSVESTLTQGVAAIESLNHLDSIIVALGMEDFKFGIKQTINLIDKAEFDFVASNISFSKKFSAYNPKKYIIKNIKDLKIAILSLGSNNKNYVPTSDLDNFLYEDPQQIIPHLVNEVQQYSPNITVLLANNDEIDGGILSGVDIVFYPCNATDNIMTKKDGVYFICGDEKLMTGSKISIRFNKKGKLKQISSEKNVLDAKVYKEDIFLQDYLDKKIKQTKLSYDRRFLGRSVEDLKHSYNSYSAIGHYVSECIRRNFASDVAIITSDFLFHGIDKGKITNYNLYNLVPYNSHLAIVYINGKSIKKVMERYLNTKNRWPSIGGINISYTKEDGVYKIISAKRHWRELDENIIYKVMVLDYLMSESAQYDDLMNLSSFGNTSVRARDILRSCVITDKAISANIYKKNLLLVGNENK